MGRDCRAVAGVLLGGQVSWGLSSQSLAQQVWEKEQMHQRAVVQWAEEGDMDSKEAAEGQE